MSDPIKFVLFIVALAFGSLLMAGGLHASSSKATIKSSPKTDCVLNYATFEAAITHIDMDQCPGKDPSDKVFCRAKTGHDEIIVFKFSSEGDQCLLGTEAFDDDHFRLTIFDLVIKKDE